MDFEKVLKLIIDDFEQAKVSYGIIGGFAMGAFGLMRATMDLDFLVDYRDMLKIKGIMQKYEYKCVYKSEHVSQFVSRLKIFGEIDFLHALGKNSLAMLAKVKSVPVFDGEVKINVLRPEDVIGLKLQAAINDGSRTDIEYADIENIMEHLRKKLDWNLIGLHFSLLDKSEQYEKFKKKYGS